MLITCAVQLWWLAEVCMKSAFSGEFFVLLLGVEKKQQETERQLRKSKSLAQTPPEWLFSVAFFFYESAQVLLRSPYSLLSIQDIHKSKYINKGTCLWVSYAFCLISVLHLHLAAPSDSSLDFSPHLTAPFDHSTETNNEKVLEREPIRSACRLKTHVIPDVVVVVCQILNLLKQSRTSQAWHNYIQMEVIINLTTLITQCVCLMEVGCWWEHQD